MPFCDAVTAASDKVVDVAPEIFVKVVPPLVLTCHCTAGVGAPLAAAVNVAVAPAFTVALAGLVVITGPEAVTVRVAVPEMPALKAVIVEVPAARPCASPAALIVAAVVLEDDHAAVAVKFCVELSVNVPVAVNCCDWPAEMLGVAGVTAIETRVAAVTFNVVVPLTLPDFAVIVELPTPAAVARPVALIVATVVVAELHVALAVRFCVLLSLNVPVAVNCCVRPLATEGFAGVTAIETSVGAVTVRTVVPVIDPDFALIVEVPAVSAVANPAELIVATEVVAEVHVALPVKFCVLLSLNVPVAVNCSVNPFATEGLEGVTAMETSVGAVADVTV